MSQTLETPSLWDRLSDWVNPILVKETRQALKSRGFVLTFMLLLIACWIGSFVGALAASRSLEYFAYAQQFFTYYYIPLAIAVAAIVPFLSLNSMLAERQDDTFEMLSITTLNARRIVNGKLNSALVQSLLFYSAITPFIAFTSLLQGFLVTPVLVLLVVTLFVSLAFCSLGLLVSMLTRNRMLQGFFTLCFLAFLGFSLWFIIAAIFDSFIWMIPNDWQALGVIAGICMLLTGIIFLCREITVALVTFETDNRSTGIRFTCTILIILSWLAIPVIHYSSSTGIHSHDLVYFVVYWTIGTCFVLIPVVLFICTEPLTMSRRVKKQVVSVAKSAGVFALPFLPGSARGYVYVVGHAVPMILICRLMDFGTSTVPMAYLVNIAVACCLYIIIYAGLAAILSQSVRHYFPLATNGLIRAVLLVTVSTIAVLPMLIRLMVYEIRGYYQYEFSLWMVISPFLTLSEIYNSSQITASILWFLRAIAVVFAICNMQAIYQNILETFTREEPQPSVPTTDTRAHSNPTAAEASPSNHPS